ncbi:MAG: hypothetical protein ACI8UO_003411 [Verrucomicrobiales bacterium]|jgi:hypothetical protein
MIRFSSILLISQLLFAAISLSAETNPEPAAAEVLDRYCYSCHDDTTQKGDVRLDDIFSLELPDRLQFLNQMQEQIYFGEMPPAKKKQPSEPERQLLADWLSSELKKHDASKLEEKLRYPGYGNYVDHNKLFSGEIKDAPYTPARRWLVSPQIFLERVKDVLQLDERERQRSLYGVTNPFILPERSGVRDFDLTTLNGGDLLVMLSNAQWISSKQIRAARVEKGELKADEFPDAKDRWAPRETPLEMAAVILKDSAPTDDELVAAIQKQFGLVLGRNADDDEIRRYLDLTRSSIELSGNTEGLRQMLVSVLLESEFLYRIEFGAGDPDEHLRKILAPLEAARAISYALGDRGPDADLLSAAADGRLATMDDFRREVQRLLSDEIYYAGPIDPGLSGKNMRAHVTTHPRLVRFFREFFGYPAALRVFKDSPRSDGFYQNPARGTAGSPGFLIKEADRVVDWYLQKDEDVFENLLTTEEFFVYHNKDNETGRKIIQEWTEVYEKLKDTNWKDDPEGVIGEHQEFLEARPSVRVKGGHQKREFLRHMYFFGETIGKGRTPFTTVSFAHGYTYNHSTFYSLPPTPHGFRYSGVEGKNFKGLDDVEFWDYPVEQPFKIANRKGLLTHPAWLIAHSSNFHTDPIKRGRWIREKLLAGRVPDVPITVDAQVPEDPHKTFRERVEAVTHADECWKCHQHMNPLGLPFEVFDDFGRYRLNEPLEYPEHLIAKPTKKNGADTYKTKPVQTLGALLGTDDSNLDGKVEDPFELIDRLAKSERVRQSIIRHAFRFFMGRNEMLSDSQTLIDADRAYVDSGGSFKAVVVSLLTSDSFIYRR